MYYRVFATTNGTGVGRDVTKCVTKVDYIKTTGDEGEKNYHRAKVTGCSTASVIRLSAGDHLSVAQGQKDNRFVVMDQYLTHWSVIFLAT